MAPGVPLANPVWHALSGLQRNVAEHAGLAARYQHDVAPFAALPDEPGPPAWEALAGLVGPRAGAIVCGADIVTPPGWEELFRGTGIQMLAPTTDDESIDQRPLDVLTAADVDAMLELVDRTHPGPFGPRTVQLGTYLGVRDGDALVAMAGERMRLPGYTEISAVCTDPAYRGRGLATTLVRALAQRIRARDERPILHVASDNLGAIRLYEALGFAPTRTLTLVGVRAPDRA